MEKTAQEYFMEKQGHPAEAVHNLFVYPKDGKFRAIFLYNLSDIDNFKIPTKGIGIEDIKAEGLPRKVGGLFKIYAENKPYEAASPEDFLQSLSKLYNAFRTDNISKEELYSEDGKNLYRLNDILYQDAYSFLIDKYCLSKAKRLEKMLDEHNIKSDLAVEANIYEYDVFGKKVYNLDNYILYSIEGSGDSQKHDIKPYGDVAYALAISKFDNFLFTELEAQKEKKEHFEELLMQFRAKLADKI